MTNDVLRTALTDAGRTQAELATACEVDVKTVGRWLASGARQPHPRNRAAAARMLGVAEAMIWPQSVRGTMKTGPDREVISVYPTRSAVPTTLWRDLIAGATREITLAGYTSYFLWTEQPDLRGALQAKAEAGVRVRVLLGDPDSAATQWKETVEGVAMSIRARIDLTLRALSPLAGTTVEVRLSDWHLGLSVWRFDDDMLVCPHVANLLGHESPALHLRRRQHRGVFDQFAVHLDAWDHARPWPHSTGA